MHQGNGSNQKGGLLMHQRLGLARGLIAFGLLLYGCASAPPAQVAAIADQSVIAERPEWRVGDRWLYRTASGRTFAREVEGREGNLWVVRVGSARWSITDDLAVKTTAQNDFEPAINYFDWPLRVKKSWTVDCLCKNTGAKVKGWPAVERYEAVTVPAGTFNAFKIHWTDGTNRRPQVYWYAPAVKSFVRWEDHEAGTVSELIEYRVK